MDPKEMMDMARFESYIEAPLISSQDFAHEMTDLPEMVPDKYDPFELESLYDICVNLTNHSWRV